MEEQMQMQHVCYSKTLPVRQQHPLPIQSRRLNTPKNNTADQTKECSGVQQKISCSASLQSEKVAYSAIGGCIDSQGYSFPYNSTNAVSVHVFLQNDHTSQAQSATDGLQSRNTAYSATNGFNVNHSQIMAYLQDYHPESASFSFEHQNASYDYYPPQSAANSNQLQDAVFKCPPEAAAYRYLPQNAAYSAPTNLPTSKGQFSEPAYLDDLNAALARRLLTSTQLMPTLIGTILI